MSWQGSDPAQLEGDVAVCGIPYRIVRLLGHGKGGYSYLAEHDGMRFVIKQIHHEPCDYYVFGDKIAAEERDYAQLCAAGVRIPRLIALDRDAERLVKEYADGPTIAEIIEAEGSAEKYLPQVRAMAAQAQAAGLNIDYYPTNFVVQGGELVYVDYECNGHDERWDFEHWGLACWMPARGA